MNIKESQNCFLIVAVLFFINIVHRELVISEERKPVNDYGVMSMLEMVEAYKRIRNTK